MIFVGILNLSFGLGSIAAFGSPVVTTSPVDVSTLPKSFCALYWTFPSRGPVPEAFCSGTLVAPNQILTAAHCLKNTLGEDPDSLWWSCKPEPQINELKKIPLDSFRLSDTWARSGDIDPHKEDWTADFAIVFLPRDETEVTVIELATATWFKELPPKRCVHVGFGLFFDQKAGKLVAGRAEIKNREIVKKEFAEETNFPDLFDGKYPDPLIFTDASETKLQKGDSGGALICQKKDSTWILLAVHSMVMTKTTDTRERTLARRVDSGVYTNVSCPVFDLGRHFRN